MNTHTHSQATDITNDSFVLENVQSNTVNNIICNLHSISSSHILSKRINKILKALSFVSQKLGTSIKNVKIRKIHLVICLYHLYIKDVIRYYNICVIRLGRLLRTQNFQSPKQFDCSSESSSRFPQIPVA